MNVCKVIDVTDVQVPRSYKKCALPVKRQTLAWHEARWSPEVLLLLKKKKKKKNFIIRCLRRIHCIHWSRWSWVCRRWGASVCCWAASRLLRLLLETVRGAH